MAWTANAIEWLWTSGREFFAGWYAPALAAVCLLQYCVHLHRLIAARREAAGYRREMEGLAVELAGAERERTLIQLENAILLELVAQTELEPALGLLLRRFVPDTRRGLAAYLEPRTGAWGVRLGRGLSDASRQTLRLDPLLLKQLHDDPVLMLDGPALAESGLLERLAWSDRRKLNELFVLSVGNREEPVGVIVTTALYPPAAPLPQQLDLAHRLVRSVGDMLARLATQLDVERQARHDGLTDLANRREFDREIAARLNFAAETGSTCSLLLIDLDHFKAVNDTCGHLAGDAVLRGMAELLRAQTAGLPASDRVLAARYGGDEIAVVLPDVGTGGAFRMAEAIRASVAAHEFFARGQTLRVTASIGLATFPDEAATVDELIVAADEALYQAKAEGRNRVCAARRLAAARC